MSRQSQHVGPIIFGDGTARAQLEEVGVVVTFRPYERTTGETWWRESRTGPKRGDVLVEELRPVDPRDPFDLAPAQHLSGFDSVTDWMEAIEDLHGELPEVGVLYRVTARNDSKDAGGDE